MGVVPVGQSGPPSFENSGSGEAMKADHLSFKRAASVSMLGLAIQIAITLILLLYGLFGKDNAALSASFFSMVGVGVWLVLLLLFDQHRRERVEAMEAEALASEAATSVFDEGAADLRIASKRLQTWYKFVIPITSLLFGGALVALGVWRFQLDEGLVREGELPAAAQRGWAMALGLIIAFIGFVFAPLFFASLGLHVDFVANFDLGLCLVVVAITTVGKLVGCRGGAWLAGIPAREGWAIAFGMNASGAMGIILGLLALEVGLIDERLFVE